MWTSNMYAWEAWTEEFVETFTAALVDHDMADGGGRHGCGRHGCGMGAKAFVFNAFE